MKKITALFISGLLLSPLAQASGSHGSHSTPSPAGASAYIISPSDGETVGQTVTVKFGLQGMGIAPAGIEKAKTGHHHLIIDGKKLPAMDKPMGKSVMHFGGGQTEKTISLSPGKHTLQLVLGNHQHIPHNPPVVSKKITITVK